MVGSTQDNMPTIGDVYSIHVEGSMRWNGEYKGADCDCTGGCRGVSFSRCKLCALRDFLAQFGV